MKHFSEYFNIHEKLYISDNIKTHGYSPKTNEELCDIVKKLIVQRGPDADLNDIDTSKIKDMSNLFFNLFKDNINIRNIDISRWNVSQVNDMTAMFFKCEEFDCDISHWDVSNVEATSGMFYRCKKFSHDLSKWKTNKIRYCKAMFTGCESLKTLPAWYHNKLNELYKPKKS